MKRISNYLLLTFAFAFSFINAFAQEHTHSIRDIFLVLPDSVFTGITQLNFPENAKFPIEDRERMLQDWDAHKKLKDTLDPRFKITFLNENNHLMRCVDNELNLNIKLWTISEDEEIIAIDGNYMEDWVVQTVNFYSYKGGKLIPANPIPDMFPISLFYDTSYLKRMEFDEDYPLPNPLIEFSPTGPDVRVRIQREIFDTDLLGSKGQPITRLNFSKKRYEWIIYYFKDGKFAVPSKNALNVKY